MQITVLVDNNTLIDRYFLAEPGLSLLIEDRNMRVLFDTGYSDIFIRNAQKMGKNLGNLDYIVLSHGHMDHTWGLDPLIRYYTELKIENRPFLRPALVAHPKCIEGISGEGLREIGPMLSKKKLSKHFDLHLDESPLYLSDRLIFLGQIPRENEFEICQGIGKKDGYELDDRLLDDSALVYKTSKGLVIITGCSHSGICNMIEYAKRVCRDDRVLDIVGGFHLINPDKIRMESTIGYFKALAPKAVHACHCTDLESKIALSRAVNLKQVGVGLSLAYEP